MANPREAYTEQWSLNVQRQLTRNTVLQVGYVGNRSLHLMLNNELNPVIPGTSQRRYPAWSTITYTETCCNANYNSLQVGLRHRVSRGFTFDLNYTYGHSLDQGGTTFGPRPQDPFNLGPEYATSDYDVRHNLEFDYVYQLPTIPRIPGWLGKGWQINGITTLRSGLPINVVCGCDLAGIGAPNSRPDLVPGVPLRPANYNVPDNQVNIAAFAVPKPGTFGDAGRNLLSGPPAYNWNFSMFKTFHLTENKALEFRAEAFNLFNTPQFSNPTPNLASPSTFSQSFSTVATASGFGSNRQIQFALKFLF